MNNTKKNFKITYFFQFCGNKIEKNKGKTIAWDDKKKKTENIRMS